VVFVVNVVTGFGFATQVIESSTSKASEATVVKLSTSRFVVARSVLARLGVKVGV
jgi:hypothetical protein